jgi:SEC-C motif-containing protein
MNKTPATSTLCPCGTHKTYALCCGVFIDAEKIAPTPETLLRSRYTAFTQGNVEYIADTMRGAATQQFDAENARRWAQHAVWLGLEVIRAQPVTDSDNKAFAEFIIRYRWQGKIESIHEISEFQRENARWYYVNGEPGAATAQRRNTVKIGRNDPCPCNSGKKHKKCCGL